MMGAFLYGAACAAGVCLVVAVFILAAAAALMVRDEVVARRRCQRMIREAVGGLGEEDLEALLRGDEREGGRS